MSKINILGALLFTTISMSGCFEVEGCIDNNALNYEAGADIDDGSCQYSRVIFYKALDGPEVTVTVDGNTVGTVTAFYPRGPGNCSAAGNAYHQLTDGELHDWNAEGGRFLNSGTVGPSRSNECIRVRVF